MALMLAAVSLVMVSDYFNNPEFQKAEATTRKQGMGGAAEG